MFVIYAVPTLTAVHKVLSCVSGREGEGREARESMEKGGKTEGRGEEGRLDTLLCTESEFWT